MKWVVGLGLVLGGLAWGQGYPDAAYSRPVTDRWYCFDTASGLMLWGNTVQRAEQFHWSEFVPVDGATLWRFKRKGGTGAPAVFGLVEGLRRAPDEISFHVRNAAGTPLSFGVHLQEVGWNREQEKQCLTWVMPSETVVAPGAEAEITVSLSDAVTASAERPSPIFPARLSIVANGVEDEAEYEVFFGNLVVRYRHAKGVLECAVAAPETVATDETVAFTVTAGSFADGDASIEVRDEPHVLWRFALTREERESLAKTGSATVTRRVPWFLPARELTAGLVVDGYRASGTEARFRVENAASAGFPQTERRGFNGRPTFFVDGKPLTWSGYASYDYQPGNVGEFGASGADMFVVPTNAGQHIHQIGAPTWRGGDSYDFGELDERVAMSLQANPDGYITLRVSLALPPSWIAEHPESRALVRTDKGDFAWQETGATTVSLASAAWRIQQEECLRRLLGYCEAQPWAKRVAAVILSGEVTEEWFAWGCNDGQYADYSADNATAFAGWCAKKGYPFRAVPSPAERSRAGYDIFPGDDAGRAAAAYAQFNSEQTAEVIERFAGIVKDATKGRCLVGAFYGYVIQLAGELRQSLSGHFALKRVLDCPDVDFLLGIPLHNFRRYTDGYDLYTSATESIFAHGKGFVNENDLFSWLHHGPWYTEYDAADPRRGAINMHRRVLANDMVHGASRQWFSLLANWHHDAGLQGEFAREMTLNRRAAEYDRTSVDEVAFVVDDTSFACMTPGSTLPRLTHADLLYALGRTGAPVGVWLLSDVDRLPERIKVVVVGDATGAAPEDLDELRGLIARGGRTVVVVGPAGLVNPATYAWDLEATRRLTGLPVTVEDAMAPGTASLAADGREVCRIESLRPRAYVEGEGWLRYGDGKAAGAERPLENGGRLIWCGVAPLDSGLLRGWLESAGVHCYAPLGFTVHASAGLVAVTAPTTGEAALRWPEPARVTDLFEGWSGSGAETACPFEAGQTQLFVIDR